jgi:outer membrane murein-binding lipoprotein Lpp
VGTLAVASAALLGATVLAGCTGQEESGPASARVSAWVSGAGGGAAIGTLEADSANIDHALSHHQPPAAVKTVCALLTNDAETAIGNLPTPDTRLTDDLNNAYEKAAAAGDDCYKGAEGNASLLRRSASERGALPSLVTTALDRIESITGHTPSTSTTQPDGSCADPFGGCN